MYLNVRRYRGVAGDKTLIEQSVRSELLPELERHGCEGYLAFWTEDGGGVSVSIFAGVEDAQRSTDAVRRWILRHQHSFPERFEEFSGECFSQESANGERQGPGAARQPLYVLIRTLVSVPRTQDTRAFVEQRTLPMITRSPGFRGVYMLWDDREEGRAAVVTLFEKQEQAETSHAKALQLLKEGLPAARVERVLQGQSVVRYAGRA